MSDFYSVLKRSSWHNAGICYGRATFLSEEDAKEFSALVKAEGRTANGGWYDGMPLGAITHFKNADPPEWQVTY